MIDVPKIFQVKNYPYPIDNNSFEEWFFDTHDTETEREYLPIFWTGYYVRNGYGQDELAKVRLQNYLNTLDRDRPMYTICQYDDGVLNDISKLDLKVFGMGSKCDYQLPLICSPHEYFFNHDKVIFCNFIGNNTHPIRRYILDTLSRNPKYYIAGGGHDLRSYCEVLSKSVFTLAPRGYGASSFRIMEALQYGSIPVYISDEFLFPHGLDFQTFGVVIKDSDVDRIDEILSGMSQEKISELRANGKRVYEDYFTYEANKRIVYEQTRNFTSVNQAEVQRDSG